MLRLLAKGVLRRYRPRIIAVTGSVGKTTTKELIAAVLSTRYDVRANPGSYNSEFGVPLTILGEPMKLSVKHWAGVLVRGLRLITQTHDYPELLVLEMGADRPGDMRYLTAMAPPDVAVVTNVRNVHLENYPSREAIVDEKSNLVRNLQPNGVAVLNVDDTDTRMMRPLAPHGVIYYGLTPDANVWISDDVFATEGISATLNVSETEGGSPQTWLLKTRLLGRHQLSAAAAAVAVGLALEVPVGEALAAIADFTPPAGRGRLLSGRHGLRIIDDTYNASPQAMIDALAALQEMPGPRWAVLGDMAELGAATAEEHRRVGEYLAPWLDHLITIGDKGALIGEAARRSGLGASNVTHAANVREAAVVVDPGGAGGTVLVKASQATMYLERVVEALLLDPRDRRLLVRRQDDPAHHHKLAEYA